MARVVEPESAAVLAPLMPSRFCTGFLILGDTPLGSSMVICEPASSTKPCVNPVVLSV